MFKNKKVLIVVSGSVSAYKSASLVRLLIKQGASTRVVMTKSAEEFIPSKTLSILSGYEVLTDLFSSYDREVVHIEWANWADYIFVVPATANIIGKIANGIADDAATATIMASKADKIIAPAMNDAMLNNAAVKRNLDIIKNDGWLIIDPEYGFLAEGYEANGRLQEPEKIIAEASIRLQAKLGKLKGKHVVITAGGTVEALDPVRYLTNRSSGKMGYALARAAVEAGSHVTLITTVDKEDIYGVTKIFVKSTQEMLDQSMIAFKHADIFIAAAAVSDFRPITYVEHKIKKQDNYPLQLTLIQNPDILKTIGSIKNKNQIVVGFAAETQNIVSYGQNKLNQKNADMIIANDVSNSEIGFSSDDNSVTIISQKHSPKVVTKQSKIKIARIIIDSISEIVNTN